MIVVLDTSIILSHLLSRGDNNTVKIFTLAKAEKITLVICKETLQELKTKLSSNKIKELPQYKSQVNAVFVAWYQYNAKIYRLQDVDIKFHVRDPKDSIYLKLALISKANYLISGDKDLLVLKKVGKTKILKPQEFVKLHRAL